MQYVSYTHEETAQLVRSLPIVRKCYVLEHLTIAYPSLRAVTGVGLRPLARSLARSLAKVAGSNPAGGMDVCLL